MTTPAELPGGYKFARDLEEGDTFDIACNHYVVTDTQTNAFKDIVLWLQMTSTHALYEAQPGTKASMTLSPDVIVKIYQ